MEKDSVPNNREDHIELPPGFRFHPTDEELITHYLSNKVVDSDFNARAIGEVDLNKCEPWDLPWKAKLGEKEWYFFCVRDRKYPTGLRTNRATEAGYWKATGKDKEIFRGKTLVGMKKTLVFYKGRAPKGEKTNWVMHEYRLETKFSFYKTPKMAKNEWVISRVFQKSPSGKKTHLSSLLSSLMDSPASSNRIKTTTFPDPPHVTCFSNPMDDQKRQQQELIHCFNSSLLSSPFIFPNPSSVLMQEKVVFRALLESHGSVMKQNFKTADKGLAPEMMNIENTSVVSNHEMGQRHFDQFQQEPSPSAGPLDFDCLWNY